MRSDPPARECAVSAAVPAVRRCAARRSDGPFCGRRATPAGTRRCCGGGGTPFPASRAPRHGNVAVRASVRARGYGDGRRARCRCVAELATALKARVLHVRAWNFGYCLAISLRDPHSMCRHKVVNGVYWEDETNSPDKHLAIQKRSHVAHVFAC